MTQARSLLLVATAALANACHPCTEWGTGAYGTGPYDYCGSDLTPQEKVLAQSGISCTPQCPEEFCCSKEEFCEFAGVDGRNGDWSCFNNAYANYPNANGACADAVIGGDPHINLPHGGKADFRGEHKEFFNFLSAKDLSLNVMTELADFELHSDNSSRHKNIHGSFITQAHIVARTITGKMLRASFYSEMIGEKNIAWANYTVDDSTRTFKLGPHKDVIIEDIKLETDYSSLHVYNPEFHIVITPHKFQSLSWERNVVGLTHQLDISIKLRVPEDKLKVAPHGIIGQSWDGDGKAIDGEQDKYPENGEFTTYAMAKGAIEGTPNDYKVASRHATNFKFSRFDATSAAPRDVEALVAAGVLNTPKAGNTNEVVGSTEYNFTGM